MLDIIHGRRHDGQEMLVLAAVTKVELIFLSRSDLIGAIRDRERICCGSFECHTLNNPARSGTVWSNRLIHSLRRDTASLHSCVRWHQKKRKKKEITLRLFGRVFLVPCAAPNHSSLALQDGRRSSRGRGRVRKTCWKAGGRTEAGQMKSHPSIYVPGFLFISSCKGGRRGRVCCFCFFPFFYGLYSNAQRVKLFLEPRV